MTSLRRATVIYLMSDIEGSTRLIGLAGDAFPRLLDEHHALIRTAVTEHGGNMVSAEGDAVFAVFPSAGAATAAAIDAQRALATHAWPARARVKVRMGIHAGEAVRRGRNYTGLDVHRTARIMSAAWGGQVITSDAVRALAGDALPGGVGFRDLGVHQLRDMPGPERLYQLTAPGIETDFPPPRSTVSRAPTNLPTPLTRLVGRTDDIEAVSALLESHRLVTLLGPGGSGKTRLSIEVARRVQESFSDGVWFVALEVVRDAQLVVPTIAQTLGVHEQAGRPAVDALAERLEGTHTLLVLDNVEQVIEAAEDLARLLSRTASLAFLVSSREPLAIAGEQTFQVLPLTLPSADTHQTVSELDQLPAIQLFMERARDARPEFALTDANAATVASISRRLDGLPLAIELAAARIAVLSPDAMLERLERSLSLLAASRRDLPARQRTLRGAIDWSHELLSEPERAVFRRCSVFAGGMDLEALEEVVDPERAIGADMLDLASALVDRSLLSARHEGQATRFFMLETIREYAAERLAAAGEANEVQARHAAYYAAMAEGFEDVMTHPRGEEILDQLDRELGNLRAAIAWALAAGQTDVGLRLAVGLNDFWHLRNHIGEAVRALEELVAASEADGDTILRARGLLLAGGLLTWLGDPERSRALSERGTAMAEQLGDLLLIALGKSSLGWSTFYSRPEDAFVTFVEGVAAARAAGVPTLEMECLMGQAWTYLRLDRPSEAGPIAAQVVALGDRIGSTYITTFAFVTLGILAAEAGDEAGAVDKFGEGLRRSHRIGAHVGTALALEALALVAVNRGDTGKGAVLAAASERLREEMAGNVGLSELGRDPPLTLAREKMAEEEYRAAIEQGRSLTLEDAVALALSEP